MKGSSVGAKWVDKFKVRFSIYFKHSDLIYNIILCEWTMNGYMVIKWMEIKRNSRKFQGNFR
jgi:hypothetical protein